MELFRSCLTAYKPVDFILSTESKIPARIYSENTSRVQYMSGVEQGCMFLWSDSVD